MHFRNLLAKAWAYGGIAITCGMILFLFAYVFWRGSSVISWSFLTENPSGLVLGTEGGIYPAIIGSLVFTCTAVVIGSVPAIATALFVVFFCKSRKVEASVHLVVQCIAGIPSIVLGLFAYSLFVGGLGWGRCIMSGSMALAIMILPFIEVRAEKAFRELDPAMIRSAYALGCTKSYTVWKLILPACRGELLSGIILGSCYAMGATAPLIFTGAVAFASVPSSLMEPAMALPLHLYLLVAQGTTSLDTAYGTAFVMMAIILISNASVTFYARRRQRQWGQR